MEVRVVDLNRVLHAVDDLSNIDKDRSVKSGLNAAGNVFRTGGLRNLNSRLGDSTSRTKKRAPGNLKESLTRRVKKSRPGVLIGFYRPLGNHAHLVDSGTKKRSTTKGKNSGIMPANHFWTDAAVSEEAKAMQALYTGVERAVQRINDRQK